jgi:hypothetical protein
MKVATAMALAARPLVTKTQALRATQSRLMALLTRGGGGGMPLAMPFALTRPMNSCKEDEQYR